MRSGGSLAIERDGAIDGRGSGNYRRAVAMNITFELATDESIALRRLPNETGEELDAVAQIGIDKPKSL